MEQEQTRMQSELKNATKWVARWGRNELFHDDVIKWKHFPRYWLFVWGFHYWPVYSPYKGQWRGALMFSLICTWKNGWVNNRDAGDLIRSSDHYDVSVMQSPKYVAGMDAAVKLQTYKWHWISHCYHSIECSVFHWCTFLLRNEAIVELFDIWGSFLKYLWVLKSKSS